MHFAHGFPNQNNGFPNQPNNFQFPGQFNHGFHPQPHGHFVPSGPAFHWEKFHGSLPHGTVYASDSYAVIRADNGKGDLVVGKYCVAQRQAYIPYGGKEIPVSHNVEVLVAAPGAQVNWVSASHGHIPNNAVGPIGSEGLYVGRAVCPHPENKPTPGKVHTSHKCLYMPWGGKEQKIDNYEVLVITANFPVPTQAPFHWEKFHGSLPHGTVYASEAYAVIRADNGKGDLVVGKYCISQRQAYIPYGGKEVPVSHNVEVLVAAPGTQVNWVSASHGHIPNNAVGPVGSEGLYVGRAVCPHPENKHTPGKVHAGHKCLYMPWGGNEQKYDNYEVCVISTNYYPGPTPTQTPYKWEKFHGSLPHGAVYASEAYAVIRADNGKGDQVVGKYCIAQRQAYIPYGGKEIPVSHNVEVLVAAPGTHVNWVSASNGHIPNNAVGPVGSESLFVGRAVCPHPENKHTPGKIHAGHKCLYMPWGGKEQKYDSYEVCVISANTGPSQPPYRWEKYNGHLPAGTIFACESYAVIRADNGHGDMVVGKFHVPDRKAYIPYGGKEITATHNIEVLVGSPGAHVQWITSGHGAVFNDAVGPIGKEGLFVGRAVCPHPENKYTPGKIHQGHKVLYMPWGGQEKSYDKYEVLVIKY